MWDLDEVFLVNIKHIQHLLTSVDFHQANQAQVDSPYMCEFS